MTDTCPPLRGHNLEMTMTATKKLYRVIVRTTNSLQPSGTSWCNDVLYCGYDRNDALVAYHASTVKDYGGHHGNRCRETIAQSKSIDDSYGTSRQGCKHQAYE